MNILILGGTRFVGRHLVEIALRSGHTVTLFNRGRTNPGMFPQVKELSGDRDGQLDTLRGRRWDAVIDVNGYVPRHVRLSAELLAGAVDFYAFVSTISVYADFGMAGVMETSRLMTLDDETVEDISGETYGGLKVLCEAAVEEFFPGRALIVRPGLIVGPHDHSDRFSYWVWRTAQGGEVLAPQDPSVGVQFIDVRDLAAWTLSMVERRQTGVYNATGPRNPLTFGELLEACNAAGGNKATFTWVSEAFLKEHGVEGWSDLPLWVGSEDAGWAFVDCSKAVNSGLAYRPLAETVADTLTWLRTRPEDHEWRAGLKPARLAELLQVWRGPEGSSTPLGGPEV